MYEKRVMCCMGGLNVIVECYQANTLPKAAGPFIRRVTDIRNIHQLLEYDVRIVSNDYCHLKKRQDAIRKFCNTQLDKGTVDYTRLSRIAHLLSLSESFGLKEQLEAANKTTFKGRSDGRLCSAFIASLSGKCCHG